MFASSFSPLSPHKLTKKKTNHISSSSFSSSQNLYDFMAIAVSLSTGVSSSILVFSRDPIKRVSRGSLVMMCAAGPVPAGIQIRSYDHNKIKVFEDKLNGVVCYKDANGEMICEGYDEGPRFSHRTSCDSSGEAEIVDLLQRCWLHESDEKELTIF
ncbi:uncharacterized protein LOC125205274 [Salvia hispanica]|uniref:uncharacterized protein LOC125205274 n=1 Tax=Salvia hispanica TaxID=49212 RepID=UPI0020098CC7|nr:uncharacterized protein LOC125205274 [Salvia hispanica]